MAIGLCLFKENRNIIIFIFDCNNSRHKSWKMIRTRKVIEEIRDTPYVIIKVYSFNSGSSNSLNGFLCFITNSDLRLRFRLFPRIGEPVGNSKGSGDVTVILITISVMFG